MEGVAEIGGGRVLGNGNEVPETGVVLDPALATPLYFANIARRCKRRFSRRASADGGDSASDSSGSGSGSGGCDAGGGGGGGGVERLRRAGTRERERERDLDRDRERESLEDDHDRARELERDDPLFCDGVGDILRKR